MSPAIDVLVVFILVLPIAARWNDGAGAAIVQILSQPIDIERFVGQQGGELYVLNERRDADGVMTLPRQQNKPRQISQSIHQSNDFGGQPAFGAPDGLIASPPFAPLAFW